MPIEDLAALVRTRREHDALSLRTAAAQAGVSFNTIARVERGHLPDTENLMKVISWLGIEPKVVLGSARIHTEATPEVVARHLRADPALSKKAAERIAQIVNDLYERFAEPPVRTAAHLRAARTFVPEAGRLLAELLSEMERALTAKS